MVEGNKDRVLPEIFARGVIRSLHTNEGSPGSLLKPDFGDPQTLIEALIDISKRLEIDPPATTYEKLDEWLEIQEMTNGLGTDEEDPDIELTEEEWTEVLRLGKEAEKRGAERWGQFGIPSNKLISPN